MRRQTVTPHDALRLLKQPRGDTRSAVRSADYMRQTLRLMQERTHHARRRSLNATGQAPERPVREGCSMCNYGSIKCIAHSLVPDLLSENDLAKLSEITGCAARVRLPQCLTLPNINIYRSITSICNNL